MISYLMQQLKLQNYICEQDDKTSGISNLKVDALICYFMTVEIALLHLSPTPFFCWQVNQRHCLQMM